MRPLRFVLAILLGAAAIGAAQPTRATEVIRAMAKPLLIEVNEGTLLRIDAPAAAVFLANPDIADVSVKSPRLIYVFGKRPGETTLYAIDDAEQVLVNVKLQVTHNLSRLRQALADLLPGSQIEVQSVDGGIVLAGPVATAAEAEDARRLTARFITDKEEVINRLQITAANQVNLRVRVAEVSRTLIRQLGIDWAAAGSIGAFDFGLVTRQLASQLALRGTTIQPTDNYNFSYSSGSLDLNALIDALAQENLVNLLAEPNLTALSGETASFLAGGEFPVPVSQDSSTGAAGSSAITVVFKKFGVSLAFTPTLLENNRISMRVRPEVSALSPEGAVTLGGFQIPALTTRRAETTVELGSGQSFAIAGLIQKNSRLDANKVPGLGDIPIIGELFKSDRFRREETELVIIVTPYIVQPVASPDLMATPNDALTGAEGSQRLAVGRAKPGQAPAATNGQGLNGPVGFVLE